MSKAFVPENDQLQEPELPEQGENLPKEFKNYMTPAGAARLKAELRQLLYEERPELVKVVQWAASNGDRSENGDYIYGKRRLREIDRRIRFLTHRLEIAVIVDPAQQSSDRVLFGARVTICNEEENQKTYQIVGIDEAEVKMGKISWISPLAKALLNGKIGEVVTLRTPKGEEDLEIISIVYPKEEEKELLR